MTEFRETLWKLFMASEEKSRSQNCRQAAIFGAIFMLVGVSLDFVVYPDMVPVIFVNRMITAVLMVMCGLLVKVFVSKALISIVVHTVALLPLASISYMVYQTEGAASPYYGGLNLVLVGATLLLRWSTFESAINVVLCLLTYAVALVAHGDDWLAAFIPMYFIFVTGAIATTATYFINASRFREFCLSMEVADTNKQLEATNEKLRTIDETKSRFFANLSHELRTPLTLILGPAESIRSSDKLRGDTQLMESLDTIEENGYRLLRLINDILDLVKLDSGESPPRPEVVHVEDFITGLTSNLKAVAELKGIKISSDCHADARPEVWLDRGHMEKIVLNLCVNALKFTNAGGSVSLSANMVGDDLQLEVMDTGQGMSEEDAANVFVRFWQADMSAKRKHRGAGIGMSLVKSLVESMDGDVEVDSKLGEGTTFRVTIPAPVPPTGEEIAQQQQPDTDILEKFNEQARVRIATAVPGKKVEPQRDNAQTREGGEVVERSDRERKCVLIADDEAGMRKFVANQLMGYYDLIEAADGQEAWDLAALHKPDLIITDLMMPEMDGIELTREIRGNPELARIPIMLITAQASESPRLEALKAGVNDFISKPFSAVELGVRAGNLLDSSEFEFRLADNNVRLEKAYHQLKEQESLLVQTEKLTSLGRMSAGIVHEVNNPLNYTKIALHTLKTFKSAIDKDQEDEFLETLADAEEGVKRVIGIISDLRSFTRGDAVSMKPLHLSDVMESARRLASSMLSGIECSIEVDPAIEIQGNDRQLCQVFVNFMQNAARAIEVKSEQLGPFEGKISIKGETLADGGARVIIRDNGCGIAPEDINRIYEPFFTKNDVGEGMGLGLSICHSILEQHNTHISVESEVGKFTEFRIQFMKISQVDDIQ